MIRRLCNAANLRRAVTKVYIMTMWFVDVIAAIVIK